MLKIIIIIIMIIIIIIIIKFNGVDRILIIIRLTQKLKMTMHTVNVNEKDLWYNRAQKEVSVQLQFLFLYLSECDPV